MTTPLGVGVASGSSLKETIVAAADILTFNKQELMDEIDSLIKRCEEQIDLLEPQVMQKYEEWKKGFLANAKKYIAGVTYDYDMQRGSGFYVHGPAVLSNWTQPNLVGITNKIFNWQRVIQGLTMARSVLIFSKDGEEIKLRASAYNPIMEPIARAKTLLEAPKYASSY